MLILYITYFILVLHFVVVVVDVYLFASRCQNKDAKAVTEEKCRKRKQKTKQSELEVRFFFLLNFVLLQGISLLHDGIRVELVESARALERVALEHTSLAIVRLDAEDSLHLVGAEQTTQVAVGHLWLRQAIEIQTFIYKH